MGYLGTDTDDCSPFSGTGVRSYTGRLGKWLLGIRVDSFQDIFFLVLVNESLEKVTF